MSFSTSTRPNRCPTRVGSLNLAVARERPAMSVQEISVAELKELVAKGENVVDVRESDEYVGGHVPGALNVPLSTLTGRVDEFSDTETTYVICQAGGRSMRACEYLADLGKSVVNIAGVTGAWLASGFDVVVGESPS